MNKNDLEIATNILSRTNKILEKYGEAIITRAEIEEYLSVQKANNSFEENVELNSVDPVLTFVQYYRNIDFRKLLLYCHFKLNRLSEFVKKSDSKVVDLMQVIRREGQKIMPIDLDLTICADAIESDNRYRINMVNSRQELYGKVFPKRVLRAEECYDDIIRTLELNDMHVIFKDKELGKAIESYLRYNTLSDMGYTFDKIMEIVKSGDFHYMDEADFYAYFDKEKSIILKRPEIKAKLDEDNLYALSGYRYLAKLQDCIELYDKSNGSRDAIPTISSVIRASNTLRRIEQSVIDKRVTLAIAIAPNNAKPEKFTVERYRRDYEETFNGMASMIVEQYPFLLYSPKIIGLFNRDAAMQLLDSAECKGEYFFSMYQAGLVTFKEMLDYEVSINQGNREDVLHDYRLKAVIAKLTGKSVLSNSVAMLVNKQMDMLNDEDRPIEYIGDMLGSLNDMENPKCFFNTTLDDSALYELLDEALIRNYAFRSAREFGANGKYAEQAKKNLDTLSRRGNLSPELIESMYIYYGLDIDKIEEILGNEKLMDLYDAEELAVVYHDILEFRKDKNLTKQDEENLFILEGQYRFQKELFAKYKFLGNSDKEIELLDYLGDLIFDKDALRELYLDGLISGENLYGLNEELALELYRTGRLRKDDRRYIILNTNVEVNAGDLIRCADDKIINGEQVLSLYMSERCSLESLEAYAQGINTSEIFKQDELLTRIRQFSVVKRDDIIRDYQRYMKAYTQIVGTSMSDDLSSKVYKAIGGKNARNDDVIDLYSKGMIDLKTIDTVSDKLLIDMIRQGVLKADDEEYFFRDTESDGKKYLRLAKILPSLNEDQKINLLASVYSTMDEVSAPRVNYLSNYLDEATVERPDYDKESSGRKRARGIASEDKATSNKGHNLFAFGEKFKTFRGIDPNYEHEVASGSYIINFRKFNMVVLEEIYRTTGDGTNSFDTQHATYIIEGTPEVYDYMGLDKDNDLYTEILGILLKPNSRGRNYIDWYKVTQMYRDKILGTTKCLHTTEERWQKNLKRKMGIEDFSKKAKINACLQDIANTEIMREDGKTYDSLEDNKNTETLKRADEEDALEI